MKRTILQLLLITTLIGGALNIAFSPIAAADMDDACGKYTGQAKTDCEAGYNGTKQCNNLGGVSATACNAGVAQAQKDGNTSGNPTNGTTNPTNGGNANTGECGGAKTEIVSCDEDAGLGAISSLIKMAITIVTVIIGVVAAGGITYAAILYASARDSQSQVQEAIGIIRNVAIGLLMYGFTVAIINWLVPGGVIG